LSGREHYFNKIKGRCVTLSVDKAFILMVRSTAKRCVSNHEASSFETGAFRALLRMRI
jgi:hypothetical protein